MGVATLRRYKRDNVTTVSDVTPKKVEKEVKPKKTTRKKA